MPRVKAGLSKMASEEFVLNMDTMIFAIESRPILWDKMHTDYKCRLSTVNTWHSLCEEINPQFGQMDKTAKNSFVQHVMRKWKNIRDTWMKAQKRQRSGSGTGVKGKNPIYQDRLSFLKQPTTSYSSPTQSSLACEDNSEEDTTILDLPPKMAAEDGRSTRRIRKMSTPLKRKIDLDSIQIDALPVGGALEETQKARDNRHLSFFEGIIPSLDPFDEEDVLEFQAGVITLIQQIRRRKQTTTLIAQDRQISTASNDVHDN